MDWLAQLILSLIPRPVQMGLGMGLTKQCQEPGQWMHIKESSKKTTFGPMYAT